MSARETAADTDTHAQTEPQFTVKPPFTVRRRSKRPRRDVETMDYLGAARRFIRAAGRRVGQCDEHELRELLSLYEAIDQAVQDAVDTQRREGRKSWARIAVAADITREAAYQRWGKKS